MKEKYYLYLVSLSSVSHTSRSWFCEDGLLQRGLYHGVIGIVNNCQNNSNKLSSVLNSMIATPTRHKFTVESLLLMEQTGVFPTDQRMELLSGVMVL